jgi:hypothetical protein
MISMHLPSKILPIFTDFSNIVGKSSNLRVAEVLKLVEGELGEDHGVVHQGSPRVRILRAVSLSIWMRQSTLPGSFRWTTFWLLVGSIPLGV